MNILLIIGIVVFILWLLGFSVFHVLGSLIHIALVIAVILIILWLLRAVFGLF
ncbi:MAG: lmo0937 family membrane protein [Dehalococcoidales bacterium]|nr:lmo0937 family membrane protein [Dehalococcoidales bacterium]